MAKIQEIRYKDSSIDAEFYEVDDIERIVEAYELWLKLNEISKSMNARMINFPEMISEPVVAYCKDLGRTNNTKIKTGKKESLSFDAITKDGKSVQIKGSSVNKGTLTSFSPKTNYDRMFLIDAYAHGKWDGTFVIYEIDPQEIPNVMVNARESFKDQQDQGRRPRFNLLKWAKTSGKVTSTTEVNIKDIIKK